MEAITRHLYWHLPYWLLAARDPVSKSKTSPQTDGYSFFSVFWKWSFRVMERRGRAEFPCTTPPCFPVINVLQYNGTRARNLGWHKGHTVSSAWFVHMSLVLTASQICPVSLLPSLITWNNSCLTHSWHRKRKEVSLGNLILFPLLLVFLPIRVSSVNMHTCIHTYLHRHTYIYTHVHAYIHTYIIMVLMRYFEANYRSTT